MNVGLVAALRRVVAGVGADAGVLVRVDATGHVVTAASTIDAVVVGEEWPSSPALRRDLGRPVLITERAQIAQVLPVHVHLLLDRPVVGALLVPVPRSAARLVLVWSDEAALTTADQQLDSEALQTFTSMAPLLDAQARAQTSASHLEAVVGALEQAVVVAGGADGTAELNLAASILLDLPAGTVHAEVAAAALRALRLRSTHADELEAQADALMLQPDAAIRDWIWTFDGTPSHLRVSSVPISGAGASGRVWVFDDITEQMQLLEAEQRARRELADSELRYRMILENASDVVFQSIEGTLQWISPNVETTTGWTPTDLVGRPTTHVWHPDDAEQAVSLRERAYDGEPARAVLRLHTKDGRLLSMEVALRPYAEPDGRRGAIGLMHDVTARVAAEQAAHDSEHQARALAAQYERARNEAQEANLAKTTFLSRMSHELRTPLNAIIGFAQLLELDELTADQMSSLAHIRAGGRHLLDLINEILDISRIEVGRLSMSMEPVEVVNACSAAVDMARPIAQAAGIDLVELPPPAEALFVQADRQRVTQVLLNLLTNAVKYNRPGGSVAITADVRDNGTVALEVRDTGPGIAPEALERIFEPFERLGAESTDIEGTGIGLTLSQSLAQAMDGTIEVRSVVGKGSVFALVLQRTDPVTLPEDEDDAPPVVDAPPRAVDVLYIEDNLQNAELMRLIVARREGATLRVEPTGEGGLRAAFDARPDLLLLDLQLPDVAGDEVLRRLRADPRGADIPVVVVTADASPGLRGRLMAAGANGFLTKPIDVKDVLRLIDEQR